MSGDKCLCKELPAVTFSAFIISLGSSALVGLGEVPDPANGQIRCDLPLARHNIDVLELIEEKTRGNLNPDEERLLGSLLYELRLKYVINADRMQESKKAS